MRRIVVVVVVALMAVLFQSTAAVAVPNLMSYQGKLNDEYGVPVTGDYDITFTIYDASTAGIPLWTETWTGGQAVTVTNGLFSIELGSVNPLVPTIFDNDNLYLGIQVEPDTEMVPRQRFASGGYAFRAEPVTPIQQFSVTKSVDPPGRGIWSELHSITVPDGEVWVIHSVWHWLAPFHVNSWWVTSFRIQVDGVEFADAALGGGYGSTGGGYENDDIIASGRNAFFSPAVVVQSGQIISIEGYISSPVGGNYVCRDHPEQCHAARTISLGFYYYRKVN